MRLSERLLLALSRDPEVARRDLNLEDWNAGNALRNWHEVIPAFEENIQGKAVVDFACGLGFQAIALVQHGAERVLGIDSNPRVLGAARDTIHAHALESRIVLKPTLEPSDRGAFDVALSQNGMEHFSHPAEVLQLMLSALTHGGRMLLTFGPPWWSPYGAHMQFFTAVPWVNLLFSERTVMNVRRRYRDDGMTSYEPELNRMSLRKFEELIAQARITVDYRRYDCVKRLNALGHVPWLRELFVNRVTLVARS